VTLRALGSALGGIALAFALAGCGLSAISTGSGAGPAQASAGPAVAPVVVKPYNVSHLVRPAGHAKYFGVEANGAPYSLTPITTVAASIGHKPNLIGQYVEWGSPFDAQGAAKAWSYGALYYLAWEPYSVSSQQIADGKSDAYITRFAEAVRSLNLPVAISYGHEMNGNWYPWGSQATSAAAFVAAWRHIHALFERAGASNVIWVWNPNVITALPQVQLRPYWPGSKYVTWVGVTGYFGTIGPDTFAGVFGSTIEEIRQFTHKPVIIAETAVQSGPDEVTCVQNLVAGVEQSSGVLGFIWFDYDKAAVDWRLESRPEVGSALGSAVAGLTLASPAK
jgi:mannan endo-1,4-beta-mannosidase